MVPEEERWQVVTKRRRAKKYKLEWPLIIEIEMSHVSTEVVLKKLMVARNFMNTSPFFNDFIKQITRSKNYNNFEEVICYGIGRFSICRQALHQLALLVEYKDLKKITVEIYDPLFNETEKEVLKYLDFLLIKSNEEGKRKISQHTLFFMPHCPRELYNNILWKNWGHSLRYCTIFGNRHSDILTFTPQRYLNNFWYINQITPAVLELKLVNCFTYEDVFNNLALLVFPVEKLNKITDEIWNHQEMPVYNRTTDQEFIQNQLTL